MKLADVLSQVGARADGVSTSVEKTATHPWYVRAVVAVTVWVGALLLTGFLMALDILKHPDMQLVLGVALLLTAIAAARLVRGLARLHIVLIGYVGSNAALMVFLDKGLHLGDRGVLLLTAVLQIVSLVTIASRVVRFKASMAAVMALWGSVLEDRLRGGNDALVVLLAAIACAMWIFESSLAASKLGRIARSVAFATPLALLFVLVASISGEREMTLVAQPVVAGALAVLLVCIILRAAREAQVARTSPVVVIAIIGTFALAAFTWKMPGVLAAAIVIALGRLRKEPILEILGSAGLAMFLFALYRSFELTLLAKSAAITGAGVMILVLREMVLRLTLPVDEKKSFAVGTSILSPIFANPSRIPSLWRVALPVGLTVGVTIALVVQKEHLLANGRTVYLELAPVDPRSLLQGDYMVLNYAAANTLRSSVQGEGYARFVVDERGIAKLSDDGDLRIRYRAQPYKPVKLGAESYFFPEGQAEAFASARYGELRVDDDGTAILVGLRDAELKALSAK